MPILSFGEYRPDVSDYMGAMSRTISNVVPQGDGYGPFPSASGYSGALAAACRGYFVAKKNDGTIAIFAGTATKLYNLNNTNQTWTDVSKGATAYTTLATTANWQFAQFNNFVFAVQANVVPQVFDLRSSTSFTDLAGTPPQASYISIVNRFVVLSGIVTPNVYRVQWSGLNATTTWTSGTSQSDFQDLADGGFVRGVAGGEFGVIFQDTAIRRMTYALGSPYIFGLDRISADDGLFFPYSLIGAADRIFYISPQGFKMLLPGGYPQAIGKERVSKTFLTDVDIASPQLVIGSSDPNATRVMWAYKSLAGLAGLFDKILIYDWGIDRWAPISLNGEYLASIGVPGLTLEGVDAAFGSNIDTLTIASLDAISTAAYARPSIIDTTHKLAYLNGPALEAIMVSSEQAIDGRRMFVRGFRPVTNAATVYGALISRENLQATETTTTEAIVSARTGLIPARKSARLVRGKIRIPAGTTWTFASGVEPDADEDGET